MKITVGDVMNSKANVRDYLSVHPESRRIYADIKCMDKVLIDKSDEWGALRAENARLREALKFYGKYCGSISDVFIKAGLYSPLVDDNGKKALQALKGELE